MGVFSPLKEICIYVTGSNCWEQLSKLIRILYDKMQPKCMYLRAVVDTVTKKEKKKAPSGDMLLRYIRASKIQCWERSKIFILKNMLQKVCDPLGPTTGQEEQRK